MTTAALNETEKSLVDMIKGWDGCLYKAVCHFFPDFIESADEWQIKSLKSFKENRKSAVRSGHGVGKTGELAVTILTFLLTRYPCKIPCTAPTKSQLKDILWSEIGKWYRRLDDCYKDLIELKSDRIELREAPDESFAVARTARKENPEAFQGFHSDNLLFVIDEASGVEEIIFQVGEGSLSTEGARQIMRGNPTQTSGEFYNAFHRNRANFWTLTVSCLDSKRVAKDFPENVAKKYGIDSNVYRVRVLGEFPLEDDDSVISLSHVEAAVNREITSGVGEIVWGLDVARFGDDSTALAKRRGKVLLEPVREWRKKDLMQTSGLVAKEYKETPVKERPKVIKIDVIGLGAGVVDRLKELGLPVEGVNVAESASVDDKYMRLRDELWFAGRAWFEARDCKIPDDQELIAELSVPRYAVTSGGKLKVEGKDDLKKRGVVSPNKADAFLLTLSHESFEVGWEKPFEYPDSGALV